MVKLTNVSAIGVKEVKEKPTYEKSVLEHLATLTDEEKNAKVSIMLIAAATDESTLYTVIEGGTVLEVLGLVEVTKTFLMEDLL